MSSTRIRRGVGALLLAASVTGGAAGCTLPDVTMSPGLTHASAPTTPAPEPAPATGSATTPLPAAATAPLPSRPSGPLDTGTVTHTLQTGNRSVVVDYWTTEDAKTWRARDPKNIQLAAHIEGGGTTTAVEVTRFAATADDGTTRTTVLEDRGEFVVTPPFNYTTALLVPPSAAGTRTLTLYVQFDLLVETAPHSGAFFRQTVLDSLALPMNQEDPK